MATNGVIGFSNSTLFNDTPRALPTDQILIAPFWGDVDTSTNGIITYGETNDTALLQKAVTYIKNAFPDSDTFSPLSLVVVTWSEVGYYNSQSDKV